MTASSTPMAGSDERPRDNGAPGIKTAWDTLTQAMQDPDYAWSWQCNLAMPIMDATGVSRELANVAAAHLMQHLWGCDITTHPEYRWGKSGAQQYAELRIAAEAEEDATANPIDTLPSGEGK